jgi:GxxExxY protein
MMTDDHTEQVIGAAIEVHKVLGPGLLESIYEEALAHEFGLRNMPFKKQVAVDVRYKDRTIQGQRVDLIVFDAVVVEIKSIRDLPDVATAQVLSYLRATGLKRALLINFGAKRLTDGIRRISL